MNETSFTVTFIWIVICFALVAATVFAYDKFLSWYNNDCKHVWGKWSTLLTSDQAHVQSRQCSECNKTQLEVLKWKS